MRSRRWLCAGLLAAVLAGAAGCGSDGPRTYRLSGKVTFDGSPVPLGRIYFDPDLSRENRGPSGYADIVDGQYDTSTTGKGMVGGPMIVRIQGNRREGADSSGFGPPLFKEHTVRVELPREASTRDFDVPASAAVGLPQNPPPLDPE